MRDTQYVMRSRLPPPSTGSQGQRHTTLMLFCPTWSMEVNICGKILNAHQVCKENKKLSYNQRRVKILQKILILSSLIYLNAPSFVP